MRKGRRPEAGEADPKDWVCLAVIGAPKGVRGALRVTCYNDSPADLESFNPLHAGPAGRPVSLRVIETPKPGRLVATIEGVGNRDAAAALNGTRLFVPRSRMPEPEDGEFYHHDLIGLPVDHVDGRPLGTVRALLDYGAGDVLEILGSDGAFLVPFTRDNVPVVDVEAGKMVVDPPAGVFDQG